MSKIDPTVQKETLYIATFELIFSLLMEAVFLILKQWDLTVLFGNILGGLCAVLNFLLMGLTIQSATHKEEKNAKTAMRLSQNLRMLMIFAVAAIGVLHSCFHTVAVLLPLFFPRIAIALRPLIKTAE